MKIDKNWPRKGNVIQRIAARIISNRLLSNPDATWQVFGEPWEGRTGCVFERNTSFAQRILRDVGYSVCEYDLMTDQQKEESLLKKPNIEKGEK